MLQNVETDICNGEKILTEYALDDITRSRRGLVLLIVV